MVTAATDILYDWPFKSATLSSVQYVGAIVTAATVTETYDWPFKSATLSAVQ